MPKDMDPAELALITWAGWLNEAISLRDNYDEPFPDEDIQQAYLRNKAEREYAQVQAA